MSTGGGEGDEFTYPATRTYAPPLKLIGGVLWILACVSMAGVLFVSDFKIASAVTPAMLVAAGRAFIGVFVFAVTFPVLFRFRRLSRDA